MNLRLLFLCGAFVASLAAAAATPSYKTVARIKLQNEGRSYDVAIAFQQVTAEGKVEQLTGIGVTQKFGEPAHTAVVLGTGEELRLETRKGEEGNRSVLCVVTLIDAEKHSTQSEFTLIAHE